MLRSFVQLDPVRAYIEALVHPSARSDALTAARHRTFIGTRLLGGLVVLAAVPVLLAVRGAPGLLETVVLAWLLAPLALVWHLSQNGDLERAHFLSACLLGALIALVAGATGGVASFVAPWLAVIPLEAALSASRRVILFAVSLAAAIAFGLWALGAAELLPHVADRSGASSAHLLGALSAALYTGAIAFGVGALSRRGERVKRVGEARYHLLAQNMTDVITRHGRNGAVTFVSPAAERVAGAAPASLMGHGLFERVHIADRPAFLNALLEAARGRPASVEYRLRQGMPAADGEPARAPGFVWVETRCRAVDAGRGVEAGEVVAVTRDISRRKQDADALESARADAERANEAKSRFLATVSHELRTPLNAIIGFSDMLSNEASLGLDAGRRADYARVIRDSGQHLLAVVNGILDVSRIEAGHFELSPEPFAVGPLVDSCCEMLLLRAEQSGVRFGFDLASDLPEIVADKLALRQVLINLVSNAIKFTPRGGSVEVSARRAGSRLALCVADTGIGIAEADLAQVGHPFFQARSSYDRPYEGTGLGLSVVKGLVELHGGKLEIASRQGEGTRVQVLLPLVCKAAPQPSRSADIEQLAPRANDSETEMVKRRA